VPGDVKRSRNEVGDEAVEWWADGGGFFGKRYMEGDNSVEGFRAEPMALSERTRCEVDGVVRLLGLEKGRRILDVPCGYGRHSIEFSRRGFDVVGVDINHEELEVARGLAVASESVVFERCDIRDIRYREEFDAIVNLFFSFGFFDADDDNELCVRRFHNALRPGGRFLMHTDVHIPRLLRGEHKFTECRRLRSGKQLLIDERFDTKRRRIEGSWTLLDPDGGETTLRAYSQRVYTYDEFAGVCKSAGFSSVNGYGDWDGRALENSCDIMIVVATK